MKIKMEVSTTFTNNPYQETHGNPLSDHIIEYTWLQYITVLFQKDFDIALQHTSALILQDVVNLMPEQSDKREQGQIPLQKAK